MTRCRPTSRSWRTFYAKWPCCIWASGAVRNAQRAAAAAQGQLYSFATLALARVVSLHEEARPASKTATRQSSVNTLTRINDR